MVRLRRVEVEWVDSVSIYAGGWEAREELVQEHKVDTMLQRSIGYVLQDDEVGLMLAGSAQLDPGCPEERRRFAGVQLIPRACIRSARRV